MYGVIAWAACYQTDINIYFIFYHPVLCVINSQSKYWWEIIKRNMLMRKYVYMEFGVWVWYWLK